MNNIIKVLPLNTIPVRYVAWLVSNEANWAIGETSSEAIGNLVMNNGDDLSITVEKE